MTAPAGGVAPAFSEAAGASIERRAVPRDDAAAVADIYRPAVEATIASFEAPAPDAAEMARLRRTAHRLLWLNPLAADPRYEPLTRGMQAALPHVDHLLPGNSIASLEALAELMESGLE